MLESTVIEGSIPLYLSSLILGSKLEMDHELMDEVKKKDKIWVGVHLGTSTIS